MSDAKSALTANALAAGASLKRLLESRSSDDGLGLSRAFRGVHRGHAVRATYEILASQAADPNQALRPGVVLLEFGALRYEIGLRGCGKPPSMKAVEAALDSLEDQGFIERPAPDDRASWSATHRGYEVRVLEFAEIVLERGKSHLRWLLDALPEEEAMAVVESWLMALGLYITCDEVDFP